jgi:hypothetical protein
MSTQHPPLREIHDTLTAYLHGTLKPGQKLPTPAHLALVRKMLQAFGVRPDPADAGEAVMLRELLNHYTATVLSAMKQSAPPAAMVAEVRQFLHWAGVGPDIEVGPDAVRSMPFSGGNGGSHH